MDFPLERGPPESGDVFGVPDLRDLSRNRQSRVDERNGGRPESRRGGEYEGRKRDLSPRVGKMGESLATIVSTRGLGDCSIRLPGTDEDVPLFPVCSIVSVPVSLRH